VRRFAAGDDAAFSEIYRAYSGPMFSIALRTLGRHDTAADAVQQAFVQAWKASASFAPEADVAPWLFTITRRTAIDLWRRERRDVLPTTTRWSTSRLPDRRWSRPGRRGRSDVPWRRFPKRSVRSFGCTTTTV
jgi:RNA polymerase sigma-70 factor (ECF subfamily)